VATYLLKTYIFFYSISVQSQVRNCSPCRQTDDTLYGSYQRLDLTIGQKLATKKYH